VLAPRGVGGRGRLGADRAEPGVRRPGRVAGTPRRRAGGGYLAFGWLCAAGRDFEEALARLRDLVEAKTPYDFRHAAVSTWLNGGVPPITMAEWAGHSVEVLLRIYAKRMHGSDALVRRRVEVALGYAHTNTATDAGT
jgi:integrase